MVEAVVEMEKAEETKMKVENLGVNNHELDLDQEDHYSAYINEFRSDFASSLRREWLVGQPANKVAAFHEEIIKKLLNKNNEIVISTTRMLEGAEKAKADLRKTVKCLGKELDETRENWKTSAEFDAEEISSLKETVSAQNIKIKELESNIAETDAMKEQEQLTEKVPNSIHPTKHINGHILNNQYFCDLCKKTFNILNEASSHAIKPCAIKDRSVVIKIEESEDLHQCNVCSTSYSSNNELESHMEEEHQTDYLGKILKYILITFWRIFL